MTHDMKAGAAAARTRGQDLLLCRGQSVTRRTTCGMCRSDLRDVLPEASAGLSESPLARRRTRESGFAEGQAIAPLRQREAGRTTADVCRRHGIGSATFEAWRAEFGGLDVSQARKLKVPEEENARLKRLLAEAMLDAAVLRDVAANKW